MNKKRSNFLIAGGIGGLFLVLILFIYEMIILVNFNSLLGLALGLVIFEPALRLLLLFGLNPIGYPLIITSILFWFVIGFLLGILVYKLYLIKNE